MAVTGTSALHLEQVLTTFKSANLYRCFRSNGRTPLSQSLGSGPAAKYRTRAAKQEMEVGIHLISIHCNKSLQVLAKQQ